MNKVSYTYYKDYCGDIIKSSPEFPNEYWYYSPTCGDWMRVGIGLTIKSSDIVLTEGEVILELL